REKEVQSKYWHLNKECNALKLFDVLIENEFLSFEEQQEKQRDALKHILHFSLKYVPYYQEIQKKLKLKDLNFNNLSDLSLLPVLTRRDLQDHFKKFHSTALPQNDKVVGITKTSGSTGEPVKVLSTIHNMRMFAILKQRELRWFRWNPREKLAAIRTEGELPFSDENLKSFGDERYCQTAGWPYKSRYFETGTFVGFNLKRPIETQMLWLEHIKPAYLMMLSARMEHLAMGFQSQHPLENLKAMQAISQELTDEMRSRIEKKMGVPVQQNYGLNEIGIVAVLCPEGGRYHVHTEHCMVEIVDEDGKACSPGERGRLLVTGFKNFGMPLIRYDTGDWAEVEAIPCPCGRTLPSFGKVHGRYTNILSLPDGSYDYYAACYGTLDDMPYELIKNLKQYQMHLFGDGSFELRLAVREKLPAAFEQKIYSV
ncbi:MAG: phenylacetate--CoA ligase family protein, partial [Thermodesulfovibrionia bacterium]|nr:phenylacetate--CoA ligase family protein [Thermodesulfovibrionia bacterium]